VESALLTSESLADHLSTEKCLQHVSQKLTIMALNKKQSYQI
jgi:hypothetical protein